MNFLLVLMVLLVIVLTYMTRHGGGRGRPKPFRYGSVLLSFLDTYAIAPAREGIAVSETCGCDA